MKTKVLFLSASVLIFTPVQGSASEPLPAASQPADLVLGNFSGDTLSSLPTALISMALDSTSGKLFVSSMDQVLRFSSQAQFTNGGIPEAVFAARNASGLAVDGAGRLWVASDNRVIRFDNAAFRTHAPAPDGVLGQQDFISNTAAAGQSGMNAPKSLALDLSGCLWVADTANNRVVGFQNAAAKSHGAPGDLLLGQPNWTNTGSGVAAGRMTRPKGLAVDDTGRLWVVDNETRVLRFDNAASKAIGASADGVLGHSDFLGTLSADINARFTSRGVATDATGRLYISSEGVLRFDNPSAKTNGAAPDGKFVPSLAFTQISSNRGGNGLSRGPAGSLWMAVTRNATVLLRFDTPSAETGEIMPDGILGAVSLSTPSAFTLSQPSALAEDSLTGKVFVVDTGNHRVLRYPSAKLLNSGAPAEAVFGQPDFTTVTSGTGPGKMSSPRGSALDALGNLWISDAGNHRVLRFANAVSSETGTPAVTALGQPDLTTSSQQPPSEFSLNTPGPLAVGPDGELWVAELATPITKVVRYNQASSAASGAAASGLLGRVDFYDQQSPTVSASTLFRTVESIYCDPAGRLWVMSQKDQAVDSTFVEFHLYRFDAAATKPNGAAAESTVTVDPVPAAAIPPEAAFPNRSGGPSQPSFFIDARGGLVLFFVSTPFRFNYGFGTPECYIIRLADADSLPAVIDQPHQLDYTLKLSGLQDGRGVMIPSTGNSIWTANGGLSSVRRYQLPPFNSASSQQPESFELATSPGGDVLTLRFASIPGRDYQLHSSSDLIQWLPGQKLSSTGVASVFLETPAPGKRFFKVVLLP